VDVPGIGPDRQAGEYVELAEQLAHDLIPITLRAQPIQFRHDTRESPLDFADGVFRVELAMGFEVLLAAHELFAVEVQQGMNDYRALGWGVVEKARETVP
jgi:hypothetical protein